MFGIERTAIVGRWCAEAEKHCCSIARVTLSVLGHCNQAEWTDPKSFPVDAVVCVCVISEALLMMMAECRCRGGCGTHRLIQV